MKSQPGRGHRPGLLRRDRRPHRRQGGGDRPQRPPEGRGHSEGQRVQAPCAGQVPAGAGDHHRRRVYAGSGAELNPRYREQKAARAPSMGRAGSFVLRKRERRLSAGGRGPAARRRWRGSRRPPRRPPGRLRPRWCRHNCPWICWSCSPRSRSLWRGRR